MDMNDMMQQAQRMQLELARAQEEIKSMTYTATSGGGAVEVVVSGKKDLKSITISPEAVDPDDVEMLQDMILVAVNEAMKQVDEESEKLFGGMGGLGGF